MQVGVCFSTENYRVRVRDCDDNNPDIKECETISTCSTACREGYVSDGNCGCVPVENQMWFYDGDGDDYHSDKKTSTGPPDESGFWSTTSEGPDCDDTKSEFTTVCCPKGQILDGNGGCKFDPCLNKDLRHKEVADNVRQNIESRLQESPIVNPNNTPEPLVESFRIQTIEDNGIGDINLDRYGLEIDKLPDGFSAFTLFNHIRTNFDQFVTGGDLPGTSVNLEPYSTADGLNWLSSNPVGSAMDFDNFADTSTVICTEYSATEMYWTFTTVSSIDHMGHFVSGHRQFGLQNNNGSLEFVVRGADRMGGIFDYLVNNVGNIFSPSPNFDDFLFKQAADKTWKNLMESIQKFIVENNGEVKNFDKNEEYGARHEYNKDDCP